MKQVIAEIIGANGCYFLSIIYNAEKETKKHFDIFDVYTMATTTKNSKGKYLMDKDCFINDPGELFSILTGIRWGVAKTEANYIVKTKEYEVLYFENKTTMKTYGHFVVGNGLGRVEYDPYGDSNTVKNGKLMSKRVFYRI